MDPQFVGRTFLLIVQDRAFLGTDKLIPLGLSLLVQKSLWQPRQEVGWINGIL